MGIFTSKEETEAINTSRAQITEVRDIVLVDHSKLCDHITDFKHHVTKGEKTVESILKKIDEHACPEVETIKVLKEYKIEQNGHLRDLAAQGDDNTKKLNSIINQTKGVYNEKENRNKKWTLWLGGAAALLVCVGLYFQLSDIRTNQTKERIVMEHKIEMLEEKLNE